MLKTTDTLDTVGWLSRSAEDANLLLDHLRVKGPNYPIIHQFFDGKSERNIPLESIRLGILSLDELYENFDWEIKELFGKVVKKLEGCGFDIKGSGCQKSFIRLMSVMKLFTTNVYPTISKRSGSKRKSFSDILGEMINKGLKISFEQYQAQLEKQIALTNIFEKLFENFDFLVCPSTAQFAPILTRS